MTKFEVGNKVRYKHHLNRSDREHIMTIIEVNNLARGLLANCSCGAKLIHESASAVELIVEDWDT